MVIFAKQRACMGKSDMIYERPSEMVQKQFFGSYVVVAFFLQSQSSKTYSGISIQHATC